MMCTIFPWAHHEENQKFYSTHEHFVHTVIVWEKREALNSGHFPSTHNHKPWSLISLQQVNKSHIIIYMHIYYSGGNNLSNHIVTLKMGSVGRMQFSIPDKHTHVYTVNVCVWNENPDQVFYFPISVSNITFQPILWCIPHFLLRSVYLQLRQ